MDLCLPDEQALYRLIEESGYVVRDRETLCSPLGNIKNHLTMAEYYLRLDRDYPLGIGLFQAQVAYASLCYLDFFACLQGLADGNKRLALAMALHCLKLNNCELLPEEFSPKRLRDLAIRLIEQSHDDRQQRLKKYHPAFVKAIRYSVGRGLTLT